MPRKLTKAEAGRLGGLKGGRVGGAKSRGGGRPKKYATDEERLAARRASALAHYHRKALWKENSQWT